MTNHPFLSVPGPVVFPVRSILLVGVGQGGPALRGVTINITSRPFHSPFLLIFLSICFQK